MVGEVVFFNQDRGWGFIRPIEKSPRSADYFFHISAVKNRIALVVGDIVICEIVSSKDKPGREDAVSVRLVKREAVPAAPAVASVTGGAQ